MNHPRSAKTTLEITFVILLVACVAVLVPSPLHTWFMETDIGYVPLAVIALALSILFSPPFILSTILQKYNVDDADVAPAVSAHRDIASHLPL